MDDGCKPLDYATPTPAKPWQIGNLLAWAALACILIEFIWILPCGLMEDRFFRNGLPKRPAQDFLLYITLVAPALVAVVLSFMHCWIQYRAFRLHLNHRLAMVVFAIGLLMVGFAVYGWVDDDVVNCSTPHPVWTVP